MLGKSPLKEAIIEYVQEGGGAELNIQPETTFSHDGGEFNNSTTVSLSQSQGTPTTVQSATNYTITERSRSVEIRKEAGDRKTHKSSFYN